MAEPNWLKTISNHAVISRAEVLDWLGVSVAELRKLITEYGMPPPRFGKFSAFKGTMTTTSTCRWRVGDVRAWLEGSARLRNELATDIGAERSSTTKKLADRGFDPFRGWKKH